MCKFSFLTHLHQTNFSIMALFLHVYVLVTLIETIKIVSKHLDCYFKTIDKVTMTLLKLISTFQNAITILRQISI